jgi:hypothetical protein
MKLLLLPRIGECDAARVRAIYDVLSKHKTRREERGRSRERKRKRQGEEGEAKEMRKERLRAPAGR